MKKTHAVKKFKFDWKLMGMICTWYWNSHCVWCDNQDLTLCIFGSILISMSINFLTKISHPNPPCGCHHLNNISIWVTKKVNPGLWARPTRKWQFVFLFSSKICLIVPFLEMFMWKSCVYVWGATFCVSTFLDHRRT